MSTAYQAFPIMEFKTGITTYLPPWVRPADAFEPLTNAYVYRGVVSKRSGYSQFGNTLADTNPVMGIMQYQNGATGAISLLIATTVNLYLYNTGTLTFSALTLSPSFTGTIANFFNYTNWQATVGATSYMYMTNGKDPVARYDGVTTVNYPTLAIDALSPTPTTITTCLDVKVYKNRLLLIRPTLSTGGVQGQSIYWSAQFNAANFLNTITGNGGFAAAPTGDFIISSEFVRDVLIVFFSNSVWRFRFTGNQFDPFKWEKISSSKNTNTPYASTQYDERATSIGNTGLIACDAVNVQRYDLPIIDYYETNFLEKYYNQAFSQRYDNLNQTWTLYVSSQTNTTDFPLVGSVAPGSDKALIYNFLENTWATYSFPIPLTCMGLFYQVSGKTWAVMTQAWEDTDVPWNSYYSQSNAPILLAGDTTGHVWYMDNGLEVTDKEFVSTVLTDVPITPDIVSTRWNPIIQMGQKVQFGYIDIYYLVASLDPDDPVSVTLNFYVDNSNTAAASRTLTLDGPSKGATLTIGTGTGASSYSGTISQGGYILPDTFNINCTTSTGDEIFSDDGEGILIGSLGDSGTINYNTGAWTLSLTSGVIETGEEIEADYQFNNPSSFTFKRIYINLIGQFIQMEIDPNVNSFMQFLGFILWVRPAGRLTSP